MRLSGARERVVGMCGASRGSVAETVRLVDLTCFLCYYDTPFESPYCLGLFGDSDGVFLEVCLWDGMEI